MQVDNLSEEEAFLKAQKPSVFVLHGIVHPAAKEFYLNEPVSFSWESYNCEMQLKGSIITLNITGPPIISLKELGTIVRQFSGFAQGMADSLGYKMAASLMVELQGGLCVNPITGNGAPLARNFFVSELSGNDGTQPVSAQDLDPVIIASIECPQIRESLADLGLALARPLDVEFYSFRAVESIRHWLAHKDGYANLDKRQQWERVRAALGVSKSELDPLTTMSERRRHGEIQDLTPEERLELMVVARKVVDKAVEIFRKERPVKAKS